MRKSTVEIAAKRKIADPRILVTGATGFLGSHITVDLLEKGYSLVLICRPSNNKSAAMRIEQLFEWFGIDMKTYPNLQVLEGSLEKSKFGLNAEKYQYLVKNVDEIIHCAANTSFSKKKREDVESSNISSMDNVLDLALHSRCYFLHHISTAYVAGKKEGLCKEEFAENRCFHNVYEETKYRAEKTAIQVCQNSGIRLNIYRPSIVYGDSESGKSIRFNALYYPVKMIQYFKNLFTRDIEENGGQSAAKLGVKLDSDGRMILPIRLKKDVNGSLNVIPVDFFVKACSVSWLSCAPSSTRLPDSLINEVISPAAWLDRSASFRPSSATTANPMPCSPARAASMAAFKANRFVWLAISEITWMISEIWSELVLICSMASADLRTA